MSNIFAQLFGMVFVVLGLSMAFNKRWTANAVEELFKNQGLMWLAGFMTLLLGAMTITLNNVWTSGLPFWITLLGWLTFLKGAMILLFPQVTHAYYKNMSKGNAFVYGGIFVFLLGAVLMMQ